MDMVFVLPHMPEATALSVPGTAKNKTDADEARQPPETLFALEWQVLHRFCSLPCTELRGEDCSGKCSSSVEHCVRVLVRLW